MLHYRGPEIHREALLRSVASVGLRASVVNPPRYARQQSKLEQLAKCRVPRSARAHPLSADRAADSARSTPSADTSR